MVAVLQCMTGEDGEFLANILRCRAMEINKKLNGNAILIHWWTVSGGGIHWRTLYFGVPITAYDTRQKAWIIPNDPAIAMESNHWSLVLEHFGKTTLLLRSVLRVGEYEKRIWRVQSIMIEFSSAGNEWNWTVSGCSTPKVVKSSQWIRDHTRCERQKQLKTSQKHSTEATDQWNCKNSSTDGAACEPSETCFENCSKNYNRN